MMKSVAIILLLTIVILAYSLFSEPTQPRPTQPPERTQSKVYRNLSEIDGYNLIYKTTDGSPLILGVRNNLVADTWAALRKNFLWVRHEGRIYLPVSGADAIWSVPEHMATSDAASNSVKVVEILQDPQNFSRAPTIIETTILDDSSGEILATRERRIETGFSGGTDSHAFVAQVLGAPTLKRVEYSTMPMVITKLVPDDQSIPTGLPTEDHVTEVDGCDGSVEPIPMRPPLGSSANPAYKSRGIETTDWQYLLKITYISEVFCRGDNIFVVLNDESWYGIGIHWLRIDGTFVGQIQTNLPVGYYNRKTRWIEDIRLDNEKLTIDRRSAVHASLRDQRYPIVIGARIELDLTNADFSIPITNEKDFTAN